MTSADPANQPNELAKVAPKSAGQRIVGFTNNLLATSVIIVVAIVVGTQLISLWRPNNSSHSKPTAPFAEWPSVEECSIEFGDRPYSLTRQQFNGNETQATGALREHCQRALKSSPNPAKPMGTAEAKMIEDAKVLTPIASAPDSWRIFQVRNPEGRNIPMVIGLRDDCPGANATRMVTWGMALMASESNWNLFVCTTSESASTSDGSDLIPPNSKRTLALRSEEGAQLIGFSGGDPETVKRFYSRLSKSNNWKQTEWKQSGVNWQCQLWEKDSTEKRGIRVQFGLDDQDKLRGLLVVELETMTGPTE
jgi:hypothetical protein